MPGVKLYSVFKAEKVLINFWVVVLPNESKYSHLSTVLPRLPSTVVWICHTVGMTTLWSKPIELLQQIVCMCMYAHLKSNRKKHGKKNCFCWSFRAKFISHKRPHIEVSVWSWLVIHWLPNFVNVNVLRVSTCGEPWSKSGQESWILSQTGTRAHVGYVY